MIQSSHRFGLLCHHQICRNPVWLGELRSPVSLALSCPTDRARCARHDSPPTELESEKFDNCASAQTCWLYSIMKCDGVTIIIAIMVPTSVRLIE
ncbi:MAG: hypothetical protein GY696_00820 [Gammaproteobacteria bacterium]|nr:hypothetical protein [Gammaproteobacteria bacterium]